MLGDPGPWVPGHPQRGQAVAAAGAVASLAGAAAPGAGPLLQREGGGCQQPDHTGPLLPGPYSFHLDQGQQPGGNCVLDTEQGPQSASTPRCSWLPREVCTHALN